MNPRHRTRATRIALLGAFALSGSACAAIWNFEDFPGDLVVDASEDSARPADATVDATREAGPPPEAAVDVSIDRRDSSIRDAPNARDRDEAGDAGDAGSDGGDEGDAADAADAADAHEAGIVCPAGYHDCAGTCSSNFSPNSCGPSSCLPCVVPVNGLSVICNSGLGCVGSCASTLTLCEGGSPTGTCSDTTSDPAHCGSCANRCHVPVGGTATCTGSPPTCGVACTPGWTACPVASPTSCADFTSDPQNCGACANACPTRDGGPVARCVDGGCL